MFDVIAIGDTTLDVFLNIKNAEVTCDVDEENCKLCVGFGHKIPIEKVTQVYGVGNAPNVAVGLSRLGLKTALYTILGNDSVADKTHEVLAGENVDLQYVVTDTEKPTDHSTVMVYGKDRTILVYHEERDYQLPELSETKWLFLGAIGQDPTHIHQQVFDYAKKTGVKIFFNPGPVQLQQGREKLLDIISVSTVFIVNKEEAQTLLGNNADFKDLAQEISGLGPEIVIITDGGNGSYVFANNELQHLRSSGKDVIEATGAGDAYSTGFLAGIMHDQEISEAMRWGTINSGFVLQHIGAQIGLLDFETMQEEKLENQHLVVKKLS